MTPMLSAMHFMLNLMFVYIGVPSALFWKIFCSKSALLMSSLLMNESNELLRIIGRGKNKYKHRILLTDDLYGWNQI